MHYFQGSREHRPPWGGGGGLASSLSVMGAWVVVNSPGNIT